MRALSVAQKRLLAVKRAAGAVGNVGSRMGATISGGMQRVRRVGGDASSQVRAAMNKGVSLATATASRARTGAANVSSSVNTSMRQVRRAAMASAPGRFLNRKLGVGADLSRLPSVYSSAIKRNRRNTAIGAGAVGAAGAVGYAANRRKRN